MIYRYALVVLASSMLATAAVLKVRLLSLPFAWKDTADVLLPTLELMLALASVLFVFGRRTAWVLAVVYLVFANVALFKALTDKPCGCLGAVTVDPWLMFGVDVAMSLSLLLAVAGWSPWANGRPRWVLLVVLASMVLVPVGIVASASARRNAQGATPPAILNEVLEGMRKNYEGINNERYEMETIQRQTHVKQPVVVKTERIQFTISPVTTVKRNMVRYDNIITTTIKEDRFSTDGLLNIQYSPSEKLAWVRKADRLSTDSLDQRNFGLPVGWDSTKGIAGNGIQWRSIETPSRGSDYVEIEYFNTELDRRVKIEFDRKTRLLPVSIVYQKTNGSIDRKCEVVYRAHQDRYRLEKFKSVTFISGTSNPEDSIIEETTCLKYETGNVNDGDADFTMPKEVIVTDTITGKTRAGAKASELFAKSRGSGPLLPKVESVTTSTWFALIALNFAFAFVAVRTHLTSSRATIA